MSTTTAPDEKLSPEQRAAMEGELAELRLRAEHALLRQLALGAERGPMDVTDAAAGLLALSAISGSEVGAAVARGLVAPARRR